MTRSTFIVAAALFVAMLGSNAPAPLYELFRVRFATTTFAMTAVFVTYPLALAILLTAFAPLPDRLGRRPILAVGLVAAALGALFFAIATQVGMLFAARICAAIAIAAVGAAGPPALVEVDAGGDRRRAALVATFAFTLACGVAPFLSGVLAIVTSAPLIVPFEVVIACCLVVLVGLIFIPETRPAVAHNRAVALRLAPALRPAFISAALTAGIAWWLASLFVSILPAYVAVLLGVHSPAVQGGLALVVFVVSPVVQVVARRVPDRVAMRAGLGCLALAFGTMIAAVPSHSLTLFALGSVLTGIGHGIAFLGAQSTINRIAPPAARARITANFYAIIYAVIGTPILAIGALTTRVGLYGAMTIVGTLVIVAGLVVALTLPGDARDVAVRTAA